MSRLHEAGYVAYLVGGCVRDVAMGITPHDYDITTSASPDKIQEIFADFKQVITGIKHGTVSPIIDHCAVEITTFRIDGEYVDSRHPEQVAFCNNLIDDLKRRDFTVNAMAYNEENGFCDFFGGMDDINNKLIRAVGDPDKRFTEDALRILRALRFSARFGFKIEERTAKSIHENRFLLQNISAERIYSEFTGILCGKYVYSVLIDFYDVFCVFIPEMEQTVGFCQNRPSHCYDVYTHTAKAVSLSRADKVLRIALFLHDVAKPQCYQLSNEGVGCFPEHNTKGEEIARSVLNRLRSDGKTVKKVCWLIKNHYMQTYATEQFARELLGKYNYDDIKLLFEMKYCDIGAMSSSCSKYADDLKILEGYIDDLYKSGECVRLDGLAVNGNDMRELVGINNGKSIGKLLDFLLSEVVSGYLKNEKEVLMKRAVELAQIYSLK